MGTVGSEMSYQPNRIIFLLLILAKASKGCQNVYSAFNFEESEFNADYVLRGSFNNAPYYANFANRTCLWRYSDGDWLFGYCEDIETQYGVYYFRPSAKDSMACNWATLQN